MRLIAADSMYGNNSSGEEATSYARTMQDNIRRRTASSGESAYPVQILSLMNKIKQKEQLQDNWDGNGSLKPSTENTERAIEFLRRMFRYLSAFDEKHPLHWKHPHVSVSEEGIIVFEWWHGNHKITIYNEKKSTNYLKVWGSDILANMDEGELHIPEDIISLWNWLHECC